MEVVNTVGRRKAAVARVFVKPGKGQITINRKELAAYFPLEILQYQVKQPLLATDTAENYDITINLDGGGIKGQAEAARLGIARALCEIDAEMRPALKKAGFLTRDPREVERKKPGQPGARRKFQFSKRYYDRNFGKHGVGSKPRGLPGAYRSERSLIYVGTTVRLPRRGKLRGSTSGSLPCEVAVKRLKLSNKH